MFDVWKHTALVALFADVLRIVFVLYVLFPLNFVEASDTGNL